MTPDFPSDLRLKIAAADAADAPQLDFEVAVVFSIWETRPSFFCTKLYWTRNKTLSLEDWWGCN